MDDFRPNLIEEVRGSLERILRLEKAETVALRLDRKRSTVYRWAGQPGSVPIDALEVLDELDPDPEFLARVAGHLLTRVALRSRQRAARGDSLVILRSLGYPVRADRHSVDRATGRGDLGDD